MSDEVVLNPAAITSRLGDESTTLVPLIEEILRTRYCNPGSLFLVEGVEAVPVSRSGRWQAIRVLLGDGELCLQGLLDSAMHPFVKTGEVGVGCYVRVDRFQVKWHSLGDAKEEGDEERNGQLVYLVLEDLVTVGWNEEYRDYYRESCASIQLGEKARGSDHATLQPDQGPKDVLVSDEEDDGTMEDAFEAFEARTFPLKNPQPTTSAATSSKPLPIALARDWHDPQAPLKLTTLRSVPHLPYAQNWSCNVLSIVASLSAVEASHLPPYRQRTARLADPSTAKQVHLTVFLNPDEFAPAVGSAVLLVGVKNHRFDGGCLKKYASDKHAGRWWFENPLELNWCDVAGIKQWWADVQSSLA